jgi:glyoxylase-like metal-dependent hydrolase (beta-lactamase superfamily II)
VSSTPEQIADGLWRWTARHPEWHPGEFGREVASFAAPANGELLLIDPLLPSEPLPVLELIDELLQSRLAILITIPYHVRSSEELWRRYRDRADCKIWGHAACAKRLGDRAGLREIELGVPLPTGVSAHAIGRPRRQETPLYIPSRRALAFGDAVVEVGGELRVWSTGKVDDRRARWYRDRFNPTLEPLLELDFDRVLVTHGRPVLADGHAQLRAALAARPWYRRAG